MRSWGCSWRRSRTITTLSKLIRSEGSSSFGRAPQCDREAFAGALADDDPGFWGPGVDRVESAARFMTVHLDESLATREPHVSGHWTYRTGFFDPRPPWIRGPHAQD